MILHYANLCAGAGGVDAFLLGSELRGLTTVRSTSGYPFVSALTDLAAEVKAILPGAKLSYGADWSEYSGHQPADGTGDVYFHLDPFWASSAVDFIGIDNYFPLTDWRDGALHRDRLDGASSIYDQTYLQSRIAGGEGFDWFYSSGANRDAQTRNSITDGAYGKPWVFRPKDIRNWWLNPHYDRPGGVENAAPTSWVPQSKPVWFTEIGCPSVDKGANQPNAFVDAKSTESTLPYYSGGQSDPAMPLAFAKAQQDYWRDAGPHNPVSNLYGAPMVDAARLFHWCWDARPFPAFPARSDVWSDAANYVTGHWLNGRLGSVSLPALIQALAARFEIADVDVDDAVGLADGFVIDKPMSAREALDDLLQVTGIDALESDGHLKFVSRRTKSSVLIDAEDLVEDAKASPLLMRNRVQEADLPVSVHVGYAESGLDYRQAAVAQSRSGTSGKSEMMISVPLALPQHQAQALADVVMAEAHAARETAHFSLPLSCSWAEPGDVLALDGDLWRVTQIQAGENLRVTAVAHDPAVYDPPPAPDRGVAVAAPIVYGAPDALMLDLALAADDGSAAPRVAAQSVPWPGSLALYRQTGSASLTLNRLISQQATMGETLTPLASGRTARIDFGQTLDVLMHSGALVSLSDDALAAGGNAIALGNAADGFEILQFRDAVLIAANTYRLSGLLRAQAGSGPEMASLRAAGQSVVLLDAAVVQPVMNLSEAGLNATWRIGPQQLDPGDASYVSLTSSGQLKALRPLSPAYLRLRREAGGVRLSWIRRTRTGGDSWELSEVPLGEETESYRLEIGTGASVLRRVTLGTSEYFYATASMVADFGTTPSTLTARVAQISAAFGPGAPLEGTLDV